MAYLYEHRVFSEIRRKVLYGELPQGQPINIANLADSLTVSAAPVRDALIRLTERGLVENHCGRGFFVVAPAVDELLNLTTILKAIYLTEAAQYPIWSADRRQIQRPIGSVFQLQPAAPDAAEIEGAIYVFNRALVSPPVLPLTEAILDRTAHARSRLLSDIRNRRFSVSIFKRLVIALECRNATKAEETLDLLFRVKTAGLQRLALGQF